MSGGLAGFGIAGATVLAIRPPGPRWSAQWLQSVGFKTMIWGGATAGAASFGANVWNTLHTPTVSNTPKEDEK